MDDTVSDIELLGNDGSTEPDAQESRTDDVLDRLKDALLDCARSGGLVLFSPDEEYAIERIDESLAECLGYDSETGSADMIGLSLAMLVHPDDTTSFLTSLKKDASADCGYCVCRIRKQDYSYGLFVLKRLPPFHAESDRTIACACIEVTGAADMLRRSLAQKEEYLETKLQLDAIIENIPGGMHTCRLFDGIHLDYASDGLCTMVGYSRTEMHELFSDKYTAMLYEEDREGFRAAIARLASYPHSESLQYRMRRRDGTVFWVSDVFKSIRHADGRMWGYSVVLNIDNEQESLLRLRTLSNSVPSGIVIGRFQDNEHHVEYFNDTFCELLGKSNEECEHLTLVDLCTLVIEEDVDKLERHMRRLSGESDSFECEFRIHFGDKIRWIKMIVSVMDRTTDYISFSALLLDITTAKKNEHKLAFQKTCLEQIDEALSAGTVINRLGLDMPLFYASPNMSGLLGYSTEEFMTMFKEGYRSIIHPDDYDRVFALNEKYGRELPPVFDMEFRFIKSNGDVIWVMEKASLLDDFQNEHAYLSVFVDITEEKEMLEKLKVREKEYRIAATHGKNIVCHYDIETRRTYLPSEVASRYGLPSEMENMPDGLVEEGYIAPESIPDFVDLYESANRGINRENVEILHRINDGFRWLRASSTVIRDSSDKPKSAVLSFDDISRERQQADEISALRENEQLLKIIARQSKRFAVKYDIEHDLLIPLDDTSRRILATGKIENPIELIMETGAIMPESVEGVRTFIRSIKSGTAKTAFDCKVRNSRGDTRWYACHATDIFDDTGKPLYAIITAENVTEAHEREIAYIRYQDLLKTEPGADVFRLEYDLTLDNYENCEGKPPGRCLEEAPETFTGHIHFLAEHCVVPSEVSRFLGFMDRTRLLNAFSAGTTQDSRELHVTIDEQTPTWMEIGYQAVKDPYSSDIKILVTWRNIDMRKRAELETLRKTQIDGLTDTYNRATFVDKLRQRTQSADKSLLNALAILDVDNFKQVNDTLGHPYGDKVLHDVAQTIRSIVFKDDIVGRIGGDEFAICMGGFSDQAALEEKIRILNLAVSRILEDRVKVTASIGIALCPRDGDSFEELYRKADIALYQAKQLGRNRHAFFSQEMTVGKHPLSRTPIDSSENTAEDVYIRTFGYFDVFVRGNTVPFPRAKAKELLAVLVDRRGGFVTAAEIISCLWEDEPVNKTTLARCRKAAMYLRRTLDEHGIGDIVEFRGGTRRVIPEKISCDLYDYLAGQQDREGLFDGSYMTNYGWGETTLSNLEFKSAHKTTASSDDGTAPVDS